MEFRLLGPLEVVENGRSLPLGGPKQRAVLAFLLLHANENVSTDRLIEAVWGDAAPSTVGTILHGYISKLRRALGAVLVTQPPGYILRLETDQIDARRFERLVGMARAAPPVEAAQKLRDALALWRGPALADLVYEEFAQGEIARLEERRLAALEARIDADLELGLHSELVPELEALVRDHPLRERLRGQLMLGLYRSGRQVEALEVYRATRRILIAEAGVEPAPELRELERRILEQDAALTPRRVPQPRPQPRREPHGRRRWIALGIAMIAAAIAAAAAAVVVSTRGESAVRGAPQTVALIDPVKNRVIDAIPIGKQGIDVQYLRSTLAVGDGAVWIPNPGSRTVTRIGFRSRRSRTEGVPLEPYEVAAAAGTVWLSGRSGVLLRASAKDLGLSETVSLGGGRIPYSSGAIAADRRSVWIGTMRPGAPLSLTRLDATGYVRTRVRLGRSSMHDVAVAGDSVWVSNVLDNAVWRVSRATDRVVQRVAIGAPTAIAATEDVVWVVSQVDDALWKIDAGTNLVSREIHVGDQPIDVAVGEDAVWVANFGDGTLSRVDPERGVVTSTIIVGARLSGVAVGGGVVWAVVPERTAADYARRQTAPRSSP